MLFQLEDPYFFSSGIPDKQSVVIQVVFSEDFLVSVSVPLLHGAMLVGMWDVARLVVKKSGAAEEFPIEVSSIPFQSSSFEIAFWMGAPMPLIRDLVNEGAFGEKKASGRTPLHQICVEPEKEMTSLLIRMLVKKGFVPDAVDVSGFTPLLLSIAEDNFSAFSALLSCGASPLGVKHGQTPLGLSILTDNVEMGSELLRKGGFSKDVHVCPGRYRTISGEDVLIGSESVSPLTLAYARNLRPIISVLLSLGCCRRRAISELSRGGACKLVSSLESGWLKKEFAVPEKAGRSSL